MRFSNQKITEKVKNQLMETKFSIQIIACKNKYFWYRFEATKKKKKIFEAIECEDKRGLVIPFLGFVYNSDIKIKKKLINSRL